MKKEKKKQVMIHNQWYTNQFKPNDRQVFPKFYSVYLYYPSFEIINLEIISCFYLVKLFGFFVREEQFLILSQLKSLDQNCFQKILFYT